MAVINLKSFVILLLFRSANIQYDSISFIRSYSDAPVRKFNINSRTFDLSKDKYTEIVLSLFRRQDFPSCSVQIKVIHLADSLQRCNSINFLAPFPTFRFISCMFAIKRFANAVRLALFLTPFFLILYLQIVKKKKKMKNRQGIQTNTNLKSYPPRSRVVILKAINFSSHGSAHSAVIRHVFLTAKTCPTDCEPTVNHE